MSYRDEDDPFEEDIVFDQAGLLSTTRKPSKSAIRRVSSGKCAVLSKTLGLCGAFLGLGLTCAIPGPLSPVPPSELRTDVSLMSYDCMFRYYGFMIGAMFGARLLDRFNRLFLVFLALLVTALLVTIIPWCGITWLLRTDMFCLGASIGFLSTGGNVLCLDLWGRNSGPFMQALHFSFSLGIFLAPFLSQPLMIPVNNSVVVPTTTPAMFPLHRLPRDIGNVSLSAVNEEIKHFLGTPASPLHLNLSGDKTSVVPGVSSTVLSPISISSKPEGHELANQVSTKATFSPPFNSSLYSSTSSPIVTNASSAMVKSSPSVLATATMPSVLLGNNSASTTSVTSPLPNSNKQGPSTTASSFSPSASMVAPVIPGAAENNTLSTTTHRAPRPKPVLTNSEKLKDKNWENDKFRKPPPEDLVPLPITMKALVKNSSNTTTLSSKNNNSSVPGVLSIGNSSVTLVAVKNLMKPANFTNSSQAFNSSDMSTVEPTHASWSSSSNIAGIPTESSRLASKPVVPSTAASSTLQHATNSSLMSGSGIHTELKSRSKTSEKFKIETFSQVANSNSEVHMPVQMAQNNTSSGGKQKFIADSKLSAAVETSFAKVGEGEPLNHTTSVELPLPLLEDPNGFNDSHDVAKDGSWPDGISLDEQELSTQNFSKLDLSPENLLRKAASFNLPSQEPKVELSTTRSYHDFKLNKNDPLASVTSNEMGRSNVIATMSTTPLKTDDVVTTKASSLTKQKNDSHLKKSDPTLVTFVTSSVQENAKQLLLNSSYSGSHENLKHTHHSKPASTIVNDTEITHNVIDAFANRLEKYGLSKMQLMYLTVGMVLLATSFLFLGFLCFNPRDPKSKTDEEEVNGHMVHSINRNRTSSGQSIPPSARWLRHIVIGLMLLILMITSGVQAMYGKLLLVYAMQSPLQLSQSTGAALTSTFLGALTSTRFACILLASALSPTAMLVLSVAICSCATWLLSALATSSEVALWIGSVMVGVGTASVFPSGLLWMQRHVLVTHRVAAMLIMGPAMGEMLFPTLAYKMMVSMGPASLVHLPALLSLFAIALWAAEWRLARYPRQPLCSPSDDSTGYQLANQHDEDDLLDLTMSPIINGTTSVSRNSARSFASGHNMHRMSA